MRENNLHRNLHSFYVTIFEQQATHTGRRHINFCYYECRCELRKFLYIRSVLPDGLAISTFMWCFTLESILIFVFIVLGV